MPGGKLDVRVSTSWGFKLEKEANLGEEVSLVGVSDGKVEVLTSNHKASPPAREDAPLQTTQRTEPSECLA